MKSHLVSRCNHISQNLLPIRSSLAVLNGARPLLPNRAYTRRDETDKIQPRYASRRVMISGSLPRIKTMQRASAKPMSADDYLHRPASVYVKITQWHF